MRKMKKVTHIINPKVRKLSMFPMLETVVSTNCHYLEITQEVAEKMTNLKTINIKTHGHTPFTSQAYAVARDPQRSSTLWRWILPCFPVLDTLTWKTSESLYNMVHLLTKLKYLDISNDYYVEIRSLETLSLEHLKFNNIKNKVDTLVMPSLKTLYLTRNEKNMNVKGHSELKITYEK